MIKTRCVILLPHVPIVDKQAGQWLPRRDRQNPPHPLCVIWPRWWCPTTRSCSPAAWATKLLHGHCINTIKHFAEARRKGVSVWKPAWREQGHWASMQIIGTPEAIGSEYATEYRGGETGWGRARRRMVQPREGAGWQRRLPPDPSPPARPESHSCDYSVLGQQLSWSRSK